MPKTIRIPAQETVTIYRRNFSSLVMDIPFDAVALNEEAPKGEVTIQGSNWVFPRVHPSYAMSNNAYPRMMARAVNLGVLTAH
jgi:hypothetical protein